MSRLPPRRSSSISSETQSEPPQKPNFQDGTGFESEFESNWKKEKVLVEADMQTDPPAVVPPEIGTQTPERIDREVTALKFTSSFS